MKSIVETKNSLIDYIGQGSIKAVGVKRSENSIVIYVTEDLEESLKKQIEEDAKPYPIIVNKGPSSGLADWPKLETDPVYETDWLGRVFCTLVLAMFAYIVAAYAGCNVPRISLPHRYDDENVKREAEYRIKVEEEINRMKK